jgi:hypothetical protein
MKYILTILSTIITMAGIVQDSFLCGFVGGAMAFFTGSIFYDDIEEAADKKRELDDLKKENELLKSKQ